ncbi:hypothetical protein [Nocardia rhizosphaerae]|uniref:Secreted protein n=1 Tax=Nocardia rhizosphaerae TaxID=1691571 RepID=A0ABV8L933_9NOCA
MNVRKFATAALLPVAAVLLSTPAANAGTGSSELLGPSGSGGQINLGCLLQSLSGTPPTADCDPVEIPVP